MLATFFAFGGRMTCLVAKEAPTFVLVSHAFPTLNARLRANFTKQGIFAVSALFGVAISAPFGGSRHPAHFLQKFFVAV
jgi:hypothetical protein